MLKLTTYLEQLVSKCQAIAKANGDKFRFDVEIVPVPKGLLYRLSVRETEEGHDFDGATGVSLEDAAQQVLKTLPDSCEQWGYDYPV